MYIYLDRNSKYSVAQTERLVEKQAVAFRNPVWQSSDYAVSVPQRQNILYKRFWQYMLIFCGKKEVPQRQVTLQQMESVDLTQKNTYKKNYILINSIQEYLPSLSRAYKEVSIFVICSHVGKGD
jgi:hypothetical protein